MTPTTSILEIWVYLSGSPLAALFITLGGYQVGLWLYQRSGQHPAANPVAIAVLLVALTIQLIHMPYATYFSGAQFVHFLLGSATVALAVPIYKGLHALRSRALPLLLALCLGALVSIASAVGLAHWLGVNRELALPLFGKSVTTPIAMGIAERIGASPTLTAVYAVVTGIMGAILAKWVLDALDIRQPWQRGFAVGVAAHGIGTSRAFAVHEESGAYASLAMGAHGIVGAFLIPLLYRLA